MQKLEIYAELFLRWIVLLLCLPLTVVFFIFLTLGLAAEYFFEWVGVLAESTKHKFANLDQSEINEPKTTT